MKKLKQWFTYQKENNTKAFLLAIIIIVNIFFWFITSLLTYLIEPNLFDNFTDSLSKSSIYWMLGYLDPSLPPMIRIISLVTLMFSMIVFSGGMIAYISSLFTNIIDNARHGIGKITFEDHIIILNWNQKAIELISNYKDQNENINIVILSEFDKTYILNQLQDSFDVKKKKHIKITVRMGDVFSTQQLMNVKIEKAKSIIILAHENGVLSSEQQDIFTLKILMLIANHDFENNITLIPEIKNEKTLHIIKTKMMSDLRLKNMILPILPDAWMGYLIAQTILMPELHQVYGEVLSYQGAEFYTVALDEFNHQGVYNKSIPIYQKNELMYMLAENKEDINDFLTGFTFNNDIILSHESLEKKSKTIVIFGINNKLPYILSSLELYQNENPVKLNIHHINESSEKIIEENLSKIEHIDHILMLSKDHLNPYDVDSDVLLTLLLIHQYTKKYKAKTVIELNNPKHYEIVKNYEISNTILSNKYLSNIISSLASNRHLYDLYEDLLTYDDGIEETYEIYVYQASEILEIKGPLVFDSKLSFIQSVKIASLERHIPIGIIKDGHFEIFKGRLDVQENFIIQESDQIISISK
jgi:hypothetical protein